MPSMVPLTLCFSHGLTKLEPFKRSEPDQNYLFSVFHRFHRFRRSTECLLPFSFNQFHVLPQPMKNLHIAALWSSKLQSTSCRSRRHSYGQSSFIVVSLKTARWASWISMHLLGLLWAPVSSMKELACFEDCCGCERRSAFFQAIRTMKQDSIVTSKVNLHEGKRLNNEDLKMAPWSLPLANKVCTWYSRAESLPTCFRLSPSSGSPSL